MEKVAKSNISFVDCQSLHFSTFVKGKGFGFFYNVNAQSLSATPCSEPLPRSRPVSAEHAPRSKVLKILPVLCTWLPLICTLTYLIHQINTTPPPVVLNWKKKLYSNSVTHLIISTCKPLTYISKWRHTR